MRYTGIAVAGIVCGFLAGGLLDAPPASAVVPPNNDLAAATNITALPYSNTVDTTDANRQSGEPLCDLISATVWYKHTPASNGTLNADTVGSNFDTVIAVFSGPATSPTFGTLSLVGCNDDALGGNQSQVLFSATAGTTYYFQVGGVAGGSGNLTFNLAVSAVTPPANDNFLSAVNASVPYSDSRATGGATLQPSEQRPCGDQIGATVWYRHTPTAAGALAATTAGSNFDTVLAVYTGSSLATLTNLTCDDDSGPGQTSQLSLNVTLGTTYYIQAGGFDNATGTLALALSFTASPDSDNDGWTDAAESIIGTNPTLNCGVNAWPPDVTNNGSVDTADIAALTNVFGQKVAPSGPAPARYDISPDPPVPDPNLRWVDTADIAAITNLFGASCVP